MGSILEKIEQALKDMLIGWIESTSAPTGCGEEERRRMLQKIHTFAP